MEVLLERSSVCAGDDVLSPNPKIISIDEPPLQSAVINEEILFNYLPNVWKSKTYWYAICDGEIIAEIEYSDVKIQRVVIYFHNNEHILRKSKVFFRYEKQERIHDGEQQSRNRWWDKIFKGKL